GAAVRDRRRLELVLLAKRERRHLAPLTEFPEHRHIAPQDELHLIDGRRDLGANLLGDRIVGRLAGRPAPLRRVADERIEHGFQRSKRRARYAAEENLAEGNLVKRRAVEGKASADALKIVDHPAGEIFWNEYVIDQNVSAAGRTQAGHTPSISDPIFG